MKTTFWITLLAGTGVAFAQPKDSKQQVPKDPPKDVAPVPKAPPTPSKDLDALKDWTKTWNCSSTSPAGEKITAKITLKRELDNFWYGLRFEQSKTKTMPAFAGQAFLGIDPVSKGWIVDGFDNHGGMIHMKATIAAGSMIWDGEAIDDGKKVPAKFTFTVDDKKKMKFVGEFGGKKGFDHDCK